MEMETTGIPWLDQPVMLHAFYPDECDLTDEQCAYRRGIWRNWYQAHNVYGLSTVYFFIATIAVCALGYWSVKLAPARFRRKASWQKSVSGFRFLAYRRFSVKVLGWESPSLGVMFILAVGFIFFFVMTLGPQPYYWPNTAEVSYGDSPPIATRTGWMALACLPFQLILATKSNMIASCIGVSHERLMVFHQYIAWVMLVLALIHTFPFIVYNSEQGTIAMLWTMSVAYWTGVAALVPQAYLTFMSISWIRNKYYEFFKATHYIAAILFIVFLFFHCDFIMSSWDYFIAAGVLYTASILYSQIRIYFEHGISRRASIELLSDLTLQITIPVKHTMSVPGQHMFLRFPSLGIHALTTHPFTICSIPTTRPADGKEAVNSLTFYVRPRGGVTGRLAKMAAKQPGFSLPVLLDGPYGGLKTRSLHTYDRALVIGCGAGVGFTLPFVMSWMLESSRRETFGDVKPRRTMRVLLATQDPATLEWYESALVDFLEASGLPPTLKDVEILLHFTKNDERVTSTSSPSQEETEADEEKGAAMVAVSSARRLPIQLLAGRPDIPDAVRQATLEADVSVGISACGPALCLKAIQDEAAAAQLRILSSGTGAKEVYLYKEVFAI